MQPLHDPSYKPWLQCEELRLIEIINIARGAPIDDWPPDDEWVGRFFMLKRPCLRGKLPAVLVSPVRLSSVLLADLSVFLAEQPPHPKWNWLGELCEVWSEESGVALAGPPPRLASSANAVSAPNQKEPRKVGRPSTKREIEEAYKALRDADEVDYSAPQNAVFEKIRSKVGPGREGFGDEAIRRVIKPLFDGDKELRGTL